jgi:hypothetical protein
LFSFGADSPDTALEAIIEKLRKSQVICRDELNVGFNLHQTLKKMIFREKQKGFVVPPGGRTF